MLKARWYSIIFLITTCLTLHASNPPATLRRRRSAQVRIENPVLETIKQQGQQVLDKMHPTIAKTVTEQGKIISQGVQAEWEFAQSEPAACCALSTFLCCYWCTHQ